MHPTQTMQRRTTLYVFMLLLVALAGAEFLVRGPFSITNGDDLASPYVSTRRFLASTDPYPSKNFVAEWHDAGAPATAVVAEAAQHSVYPPVTLAAFIPFALLPWLAAVYTYIAVSILLYLWLIYALACEVGESWHSSLRLGFVAMCLALAPFHSGVRHVNLSVLAFTLCSVGLVLARDKRSSLAGLILAVGFCLKPTTGFTIVLLVLCFGWRRAFAVCAATAAAITAAALIWMQHISPSWKASYADNLSYAFSPRGALAFTISGFSRYDDLNLQVPFYSLLRQAHQANLLAYGAGVVLFALWVAVFYKGRNLLQPIPFTWVATGSLTLIALLPMYQRNYNATVIVFALLWAFQRTARRAAWAIIGFCAVFLVPGEAILRRCGLAEHFAGSTLWNVFVMSQATWAVVAVLLILLYVQWKQSVSHGYNPRLTA